MDLGRVAIVLIAVGLLCFSGTELCGQIPGVTAPAFLTTDHSADWEPGQLLYRRIGLGRTTVVTYHNGVLYAGGYAGGAYDQFEWTDWSDASSLTLTNAVGSPSYVNVPISTTQGTHGHSGKLGDYVMSGVRRTSTPGVNEFVTSPDRIRDSDGERRRPAGAGGHHDLYFPWRLPFEWPQYGSATGLGFVIRGTDLLGTWDSGGETGVFGHTLLVGNLLIVCSDETFTGVAVYDMSPMFNNPPEPPQLLDKLSGNIGGYLPAIWRNYIVFPTDGKLELVDFSDPTDLRFAESFPVPTGGGQDYVQFQDNFGFYQSSKVNMDTGEVVLTLDWQDNGDRPAGSVPGRVNTSQYLMPLGNLLVTGGNGSTGQDGVGLWVHQDTPDTRRPEVGYHVPRPNQTNYPVGAPISLLIHDTLESYTIVNGESVILREVGSPTPIDCWASFSHDDILTITPRNYLSEDTEYVVEIVDGGIKDVAGNGIVGLTFNFSTGNTTTGNQPPVIDLVTVNDSPEEPGVPVGFQVTAHDPEGTATLEYRINYGDGTTPTAWTAGLTSYQHAFAEEGHFEVKVQVREAGNPSFITTEIYLVTISNPVAGPFPTKSSPITMDATRDRIWVVNPDNDSLTRINRSTEAVDLEIDLATRLSVTGSVDPRSVAVDASGNIWVACRDADLFAILDGDDGSLIVAVEAGYGSAPISVAATTSGNEVFVATEGRGHEAATSNGADPANGQLIRYDAASYGIGSGPTETGSIELGPLPRAIALFASGERALITRFISDHPRGGEVWDVDASASDRLSLTRTIYLPVDTSTAGRNSEADSSNGDGVPNYVSSITLTPDEQWAWYTAVKPDTGRGNLYGTEIDPDNTTRAIIGRIDLRGSAPADEDGSRIDFDNSDSPTSVAFSPLGDWGFVTAQGNNLVGVFDRLAIEQTSTISARNSRARLATGLAPQGILIDDSSGKLWVKNFMDRTVSVHDVSAFLERGTITDGPAVIPTVTTEKLAPGVFNGKQIFYNASDRGGSDGANRMSDEGYISCASCHVDGMHDGRVWDFTQRGEGLRNTIDLRGRGGMEHGNVHWTANFDEIQDFENDIRNGFGGHGFLSDSDFATTSDPLGTPKAGLDPDLDALAAYVASLTEETLPKSPHREPNGTMTPEATLGASIFADQGCATCHVPGSDYTDSLVGDGLAGLHDVGSIRPSSGHRISSALTGIDTPTLRGVWNGAPFLHNGSALTLQEVFTTAGGTAYQAEDATLLGGADVRNLSQANSVSGAIGGEAVRANSPGEGAEWTGVDGGAGGTALLELRYAAREEISVTVQINGATPVPATFTKTQDASLDGANWHSLLVETGLNPGSGNVVRITVDQGTSCWIDQLHVATSNDFTAADAHTRVASLSSPDQSALLAYLRELDGTPAAASAPEIFSQPQDAAVVTGQPVVFTVAAAGSPAPGYQWRKDGFTLTGENNQTLTIGAADEQHEGSYDVVVSNSEGSVTSDAAVLEILEAPPSAFEERSGIVSFEAEHGLFDQAGGASVWNVTPESPGPSAGASIETNGASQTGTEPDGNNTGQRIVSYPVVLQTGGGYDFHARVQAPGGSSDSFFFRLLGPAGFDTGWIRWWQGLISGTDWQWNEWTGNDAGTGTEFDALAAGQYTLQITYRESGTRLDKFAIQTSGSPPPSGEGPTETPIVNGGVSLPTWSSPWPWENPGVDDAADADPNQDEVSNLLSAMADIDPVAPGPGQVITETSNDDRGTQAEEDDQLVIRFRHRIGGLEGWRVRVMVSETLDSSNWQEVDFSEAGNSLTVANANVDGDGTAEILEARISLAGRAGLFSRIEVVAAP